MKVVFLQRAVKWSGTPSGTSLLAGSDRLELPVSKRPREAVFLVRYNNERLDGSIQCHLGS